MSDDWRTEASGHLSEAVKKLEEGDAADALRFSKRATESLLQLLTEQGIKICQRCDKAKPFSEYTPYKKGRDGFEYRCRQCHREKSRLWGARNPEKKAAQDRRRDHMARNRRQEERHPEKMRSRRLAREAVARGTLVKPSACERCGTEASGHALQAHHRDYSKPLTVEWLCRKCHGKEHRLPDEAAAAFLQEEEG